MRLVLLFSILILLSSCVGTVEDSSSAMTETSPPVTDTINFSGVTNVSGISDTRLEVFFPRATGGSGKYVYEIYVGDRPVIYVPSDAFPLALTELKYTVTDLTLAMQYAVRVEARDASAKDPKVAPKSNNQKYVLGKTYSNEVCDFSGISSVENLPGEDGKNSLRIRWTPATIVTPITHSRSPGLYEVVLIKDGISRGAGPGQILVDAQFDDQSLLPDQGRHAYTVNYVPGVNEAVVRGLTPNYNYKIRVRCLHRGTINDKFDPTLRGEQNSNVLRWATLSDDPPDFNQSDINFELLPSYAGYSGLRVTWGEVIGAFSHFRVYVTESVLASTHILPNCSRDGDIICEKINYDGNQGLVTGLKARTPYKAYLLICLDFSCSNGRRVIASTKDITTQPKAATIKGFSGFQLNYALSDFGAITFSIEPPDFTTGVLDNYKIEFRRKGQDNWTDVTADVDFSIDPYDIESATSLVLRGLTFGTKEDIFEFKLSGEIDSKPIAPFPPIPPLVVDLSDGEQSLFRGPSKEDFLGITKVDVVPGGGDTNRLVEVSWIVPRSNKGFYSHYDFYLSSCSSCNPLEDINSLVISYHRDFGESNCTLTDMGNKCTQTFSVSEDSPFRIALATRFETPFTPSGRLKTVINTSIWECKKAEIFSCTKK